MRLRALLLLLPLLAFTSASEESCMDRCENGFDSTKKCQCDSMCKYYKSCCFDYESICGMMTRGDTFVFAEDDELFDSTTPAQRLSARDHGSTTTSPQERPTQPTIVDFNSRHTHESTIEMNKPQKESIDTETTVNGTNAESTTASPTTKPPTTAPPDPDAEVCSERPFDSFMQVKNGSIYAFRGEYFFVLDQKSVLPGYPKLIKDVWGISGPIDAAFTRMNCQGKTYIFKGNKYWRFDNGVLDEDYPRDISVGFDKIPDYVDAAFALPAPGHNGKEKVFFFKGDQYYVYEFVHQPSHQECIGMSERSPATMFRRYTDVYYGNYEQFFSELFSDLPQHHDHHHFIDKDWKGLKSPVDAAMAGRIYVSPLRFFPGRNDDRQQWNQYSQQWGRRRQNRSPYWDTMAERGMNMGQDFAQRGMELGMRLAERRMEMEERLGRDWTRGWDQDWDQDRRWDRYNSNNRGNYDSRNSRGNSRLWDPLQRTQPIQTVYFFKGEKYYRVDLRSKRVDPAMPPYPRSIAKYWLGCSDTTGAEK
ncbi:vitronectin a [Boleophthalmus pectinirostris]|uniref:vitronectin a n=1 Tax=Boleophthalmus pectinirostris TaxID=150288 RepID=UPI000A1C55A5|nr:vitronectin a [Boleophthalmus pectinirostris]